jgi:hypothetical protein
VDDPIEQARKQAVEEMRAKPFRLDLWQQQAEAVRRALEDTGQGLTRILNAAGFKQLEVRWDDQGEESGRG